MIKFSFIPVNNFTLWGGFTQSYTTPSFNQTNLEMDIFRAYSTELYPFYFAEALPMVTQGVYDDVYDMNIALGIDSLTAVSNAQGYINSPSGQQVIDSISNSNTQSQLNSDYPGGEVTIAVINNQNIRPTSFKNYEFGIKYSFLHKINIESNFYYSIMNDGIGSSTVGTLVESPTRPGKYISAYYYGNYLKGTNMGIETIIKYQALDNLMIEFSHNYFKYTLDYQENEDFDITGLKYALIRRVFFYRS